MSRVLASETIREMKKESKELEGRNIYKREREREREREQEQEREPKLEHLFSL